MNGTLGPGSEIRCVDASPHTMTGEVWLVVGRVYRVSGFLLPYSLLIEGDRADRSWGMARFEPLGRRSFHHLLTTPAPEREPASA